MSDELPGVAGVRTSRTEAKYFSPGNSEEVWQQYKSSAFPPEGIIDSPQAVQTAWDWLERQGLKQAGSRVDGLALFAGPLYAQTCGEAPAWQIVFKVPSGHLCLDAYSGQVIFNNYGK